MRLVASLVLLLLPGCGLCEYRDFSSQYAVDVGLDEDCPPPPSGDRDPPGNHGLVSVDGPGQRRVQTPASASCCYQGRFLLEAAEFTGEICAAIDLPGRGDEGDLACPAASGVRPRATAWTFRRGERTRSIEQDDVLDVNGGPRLEQVSLRRDICVYPATARTTADACG